MVVFEFFFSAAAGITLGAGLILLPCLFIYQKFFASRGRSSGRRQ